SNERAYRLGLALLLCSGGLVLATFINLGSLPDHGESGRLLYGPIAWLALAIGVFTNVIKHKPRPKRSLLRLSDYINLSLATYVCWIVLLLSSFFLLQAHIKKFTLVQQSNLNLVQSIPDWAEKHPGLTMLFIPDRVGSVIALRNSQGAIVMPPIQQQPYLHRVLPTLLSEINLRHQQLRNGLAWQLRELPPQDLSDATFSRILKKAPSELPARIACWNQESGSIHIVVDSLEPDWNDIEPWHSLKETTLRVCPSLE
ncbi:MAG: hypothetical protein AAF446_06910, partial [Pseudomonadota bacterium]